LILAVFTVELITSRRKQGTCTYIWR